MIFGTCIPGYAASTLEAGITGGTEHNVDVQTKSPAIISTDIAWGAMQFEYFREGWDWQTHTYTSDSIRLGVAQVGGDIVKVTNHSNVPISFTIESTLVEKFNGCSVSDSLSDNNRGEKNGDGKYIIQAGEVDMPDEAGWVEVKIALSDNTADTMSKVGSAYEKAGTLTVKLDEPTPAPTT